MVRGTKYRLDIQALRGLAVLAVLLFHAGTSYFPLGFLGVDVFFVISGFVVTPLILRIFTNQTFGVGRLSNLRNFLKRRIFRLAPALAITLTISAILIFLLGPISDHQSFARQGIATLFLVGNVGAYKYSGDYFSPNPNPLIHTWSLSVEEQIYLILPVILILIIQNRKDFEKITLKVLGFLSIISFVLFLSPPSSLLSRLGIESTSQFDFYSPIGRIWQFTMGGIAFFLLGRKSNRRSKLSRSFNLLIIFAVVMILFSPIQINFKVGSILASFFAFILILFNSLDVLPNSLIRRLVWVGDRSYSIYLVHMPLIYIAQYSPMILIGNNESRMIQSSIAVIVSILIGAISYSKIENKYRFKSEKESMISSGLWYAFKAFFIVPLIFFILLFNLFGQSGTSMYNDRLDNNLCKFWTPKLDENFKLRFLKCHYKYGRAIVVLGDSHAMNIYNSLFLTTSRDFFVGISAGGCRPNTKLDSCYYDDFKNFLKSSPNSIEQVIFHQSGSYLISDERGYVDSNLAFKSETSFRIMIDDILFLKRYLNDMGTNVVTTWVGPFPELRIDPSWIQVRANKVEPNPIVKRAFLELEKKIDFYLNEEKNTFNYVSLIRILGPRQFEYKVGSCILFRDIDHWSKCGEEIFSRSINSNLIGR